jgi:hypothetical protein
MKYGRGDLGNRKSSMITYILHYILCTHPVVIFAFKVVINVIPINNTKTIMGCPRIAKANG